MNFEKIKILVMQLVGHSISGALVAGLYELGNLAKNGVTNPNDLVVGTALGFCIALSKNILNLLENLKKSKFSASSKKKKQGFRQYMGL